MTCMDRRELQYTVLEYKQQVAELNNEIQLLTAKRDSLKHTIIYDEFSRDFTGRSMLLEEEIVARKTNYAIACGIYFLIQDNHIIYIGQSVNVYGRIYTHIKEKQKKFDSYAYVPCADEELDILESLYIHSIAPSSQGRTVQGDLASPLSLKQIVELGKRTKYRQNDPPPRSLKQIADCRMEHQRFKKDYWRKNEHQTLVI